MKEYEKWICTNCGKSRYNAELDATIIVSVVDGKTTYQEIINDGEINYIECLECKHDNPAGFKQKEQSCI